MTTTTTETAPAYDALLAFARQAARGELESEMSPPDEDGWLIEAAEAYEAMIGQARAMLAAEATRQAVTVALGGGAVIVGHVQVDGPDQAEREADEDMGDDDSSLHAAAVAWNAITRNGVFTVNGKTYSAAECAEWWA